MSYANNGLDIYRREVDNVVDFGQGSRDIKLKQKPQPNPQWKAAYQQALLNGEIQGLTGDEVKKLVANAQVATTRNYEQASDQEAKDYITLHIAKAPVGLQKVLTKIMNGGDAVNADLTRAIYKAFVKYQKKDGSYNTTISISSMYKAGDEATGYDKLVLLKARRIVKLLKQSITAFNMKADITLGKQYQAIRGYYNTNKLVQVPSARANYAKNLARKIGALTQANYQSSLQAGKQRAISNIDSNFKFWGKRNPESIIKRAQDPANVAAVKNFFKTYLKNSSVSDNVQRNFELANQEYKQQQQAILQQRNAFNQQAFPNIQGNNVQNPPNDNQFMEQEANQPAIQQ